MSTMEIPEDLARRLEDYAGQENRTPLEMVVRLLDRYQPAPAADADADHYSVRAVELRIYEQAWRYWREHDDPRQHLSDADMDEQFWLIDYDGIPRMIAEQGTIAIPPSSPEAGKS